jgi:hypothetical protein
MNFMTVKTFNVTDRTKGSFFRFPQTEVIDLIFIRADPLPDLAILVEPE